MATKHTPGPWIATGYKSTVVNDSQGNTLAIHPSHDGSVETAQANARLIAAAPDLLAALVDVREAYQQMFSVMPVAWQTIDDIVTNAIDKATGEHSVEQAVDTSTGDATPVQAPAVFTVELGSTDSDDAGWLYVLHAIDAQHAERIVVDWHQNDTGELFPRVNMICAGPIVGGSRSHHNDLRPWQTTGFVPVRPDDKNEPARQAITYRVEWRMNGAIKTLVCKSELSTYYIAYEGDRPTADDLGKVEAALSPYLGQILSVVFKQDHFEVTAVEPID